jgi:ATP-dependent Clp protease ATP-binding subunit ClpB
MDSNKMTIKTQEAIQSAQSIATKLGHIEIDGEHLLAAMLEQP